MARRYNQEEEKSENGERWLLTYSDLITLLLALFIIMYGMSSENTAKINDMSSALSQAFNGTVQNRRTADGTGTGNTGTDATGAADGTAHIDPVQSIYDELDAYVIEQGLKDDVDMVKSDHSISIRLRDSLLFNGNSATLNTGSMQTLEKVSNIIAKVYGEVNHITVTGNTADLGHRDAMNEADSWQLSVDRAVSVLNVLTAKGLGPEKMSIEGNSHYYPVDTNDTPEGRAANRRVEITITDAYN